MFLKKSILRRSAPHRKTRRIPVIDQLIAETLLFQSCGVYTSCLEQLRMTFPRIKQHHELKNKMSVNVLTDGH